MVCVVPNNRQDRPGQTDTQTGPREVDCKVAQSIREARQKAKQICRGSGKFGAIGNELIGTAWLCACRSRTLGTHSLLGVKLETHIIVPRWSGAAPYVGAKNVRQCSGIRLVSRYHGI